MQVDDESVWVHALCAKYSPFVTVNSNEEELSGDKMEVEEDDDEERCIWFNIASEVKRGRALVCSLCHKHGATLSCELSSCKDGEKKGVLLFRLVCRFFLN